MIRMLVVTLMALALIGPAKAQNADAQGVIAAQIEAFQRDDFVTAFSYASPTIKGIFRTPDRFGVMVRNGFPMVWRPAQVEYLEQREVGGVIFQRVLIEDNKGALHALEYQMLPTPDGWQIDGVQFIAPPAVAA